MAGHGPGTSRAAGPAPRPPEQVRNVVVVGRSGAGKTTLIEALLARTGTVPRAGRVEDGTTVCDSSELERRQQRSVALALAPLEHAGCKVDLLDTPGHPDFVAELRAGLRAADAALFVVSAVDEVDARTEQLWAECAAVGLPRALAVTQLDRPRADFDDAVASCQRAFGAGVHPLHLPVAGEQGPLSGLLDVLCARAHDRTPDGPLEREPTDEERERLSGPRAALLEGVIAESEDETLLERYLGGEELDLDLLLADLEKAVASARLHPVLAVAPLTGTGTDELLDVLVRGFPSPLERPAPPVTRPDGSRAPAVSCDPDGPLVAEVVRTTTDPYLGRICLVRVFSGTLRADLPVHVSGHGPARPEHDADERVGGLYAPLGATLRTVATGPAGDVCAVARLTTAETGDTVSGRDDPLLVPPWQLPEPQLPVAVQAASRSDEDRLDEALARAAAEDPSVRVQRDPHTGQLLVWCLGEAHADVVLDRLGIAVLRPPVQVALRETLPGPVTATGRLVKQSGGHGQYAVVVLEVAPLPPGSGIRFRSQVVGGAVPAAYVGSVEKGVRAQAERGVHPGLPLVDLDVVLVDGKAHSVDSSDAAFATAGAMALREAAAQGAGLLEPVSELEVRVPPWSVGAVLSDLAGRRARVTGSTSEDAVAVVRAEVPDLELLRYAVALRAQTAGTGSCTRRPLRHEPAPPAVRPPPG